MALMDSQHLWLLANSQHKAGPINIQSLTGEEVQRLLEERKSLSSLSYSCFRTMATQATLSKPSGLSGKNKNKTKGHENEDEGKWEVGYGYDMNVLYACLKTVKKLTK